MPNRRINLRCIILALLFPTALHSEAYLLMSISGSTGIGFDAPQVGVELGTPIRISDHVEVWLRTGSSTAPKTTGHGRTIYGSAEVETHISPRFSVLAGAQYAETVAGYRKAGLAPTLELRWSWQDRALSVSTSGPDSTENELVSFGLHWQVQGRRLIIRASIESFWYLSQGERQAGLRFALRIGFRMARGRPP